MRGARVLVAVLVAGGALAAVAASLASSVARPVTSVRIAGEFRHVARAALERAVAPHLGKGLLSVDVAAVRAAAMALPWVKEVSVRRVWPEGLHITIVEREAVARWGARALLEADGSLFVPADVSGLEALPRLDGPDARHAAVLKTYVELSAALRAFPPRVRGVERTPRGGLRVVFEGETTLVIGPGQSLHALEVYARAFARVLGGRLAEVERIDIRYANGFAVQFRRSAVAGARS